MRQLVKLYIVVLILLSTTRNNNPQYMGRPRGRPPKRFRAEGRGESIRTGRGRPRKFPLLPITSSSSSSSSQIPVGTVIEKPRPEKAYTEIYPDLDVTRPLRVFFDKSRSSVHSALNGGGLTKEQIVVRRPVYHPIDNVSNIVAESDFVLPESYICNYIAESAPVLEENKSSPSLAVEYDMDEADKRFLQHMNQHRRQEISEDIFETTMTLLEREWYKLERTMPPRRKPAMMEHELPDADDQKCVICDDAECDNSNAIVFCDGCDIAVHQECYGVPFIPEGDWLCRLCSDSRRRRFKVSCLFCPNKLGAFKQTIDGAWAHLVCALWIPETTVSDLVYMEPICGVADIPRSRFTQLACYICRERVGACIQCAHKGCFQAFHATCARKARFCMQMDAGISGAVFNGGATTRVFCHKHSPEDYAQDIDVQSHLHEAQTFSLKQKKFLASLAVRRKNGSQVKYMRWKTSQGTPLIPAQIGNKVKEQLKPFRVANLEEFVTSICKYWTLKRQQRRGAALIKRYQVALEAQQKGSSQREDLETQKLACQAELCQLEKLRQIVSQVYDREKTKLFLVENQQKMADAVYFTASRLIMPIWTTLYKGLQQFSFDEPTNAKIAEIGFNVTHRQYMSIVDLESDLQTVYKLAHNVVSDNPTLSKQLAKLWNSTQLRISKAKSAWSELPQNNTLVDLRQFDPNGTEIHEERWINHLIAQEAGLSDIEDDEEPKPIVVARQRRLRGRK